MGEFNFTALPMLLQVGEEISFAWTITLGNLVTAAAILLSWGVAWGILGARIHSIENWQEQHQRIALEDAQSLRKLSNMMERLLAYREEDEKRIRRLEDRIIK
jgi:hypothetical protein